MTPRERTRQLGEVWDGKGNERRQGPNDLIYDQTKCLHEEDPSLIRIWPTGPFLSQMPTLRTTADQVSAHY